MRLTLLRLRTVSQGLRVVGYWGAHLLDQAEHANSEPGRQQATRLAGLLTPVIKAFFTDQGFHLASEALQVFGGYGYIGEYGIEQTLRDSRIAMIYEGSNEIQANDLLLRKVLGDDGVALGELLVLVEQEAAAGGEYANPLSALSAKLRVLVKGIFAHTEGDHEYPYRIAGDFLHLLGWALLAYAWARSARLANALLAEDPWYQETLDSAAFFFTYLLPEIELRIARIEAARAPLGFLA
jgi:hypothetical protein